MSDFHNILALRYEYKNCYNKKDYFSALNLGEEIISLYKKNSDTKSLNYATDCFLVADAYFALNKTEKCIELYREASRTLIFFPDEWSLLSDVLNNMAISLSINGHFESALRVMLKSLELRKNHLKVNDGEYIETLYNIGVCYYDLDDYDKALHYHMTSLNNRTEKNLDYIDNLNFIGYDFEKKGDIKNAILYLEKAIQIIERLFKKMSDEYLKNIYYLAHLHESDNNYEMALIYYTEAAEISKKLSKSNHPYYAEILNRTADIYTKLNNSEKSISLRMEALEVIKDIVGENHLYYAGLLRNIADNHKSRNNCNAAEEFYKQSMKIKKLLLGADSDEYIKDLLMLCEMYNETGELEKSLTLLSEAIEALNANHEFYIRCIHLMAKIYMSLGDVYKVYELYEQISAIKDKFTFSDLLDNLNNI